MIDRKSKILSVGCVEEDILLYKMHTLKLLLTHIFN